MFKLIIIIYLTADFTQFDSHITARVANTNDDNTFTIVASTIVEIMSVDSGSFEVFVASEVRHVFVCVMTRANERGVEYIGRFYVALSITDYSLPLTCAGEVFDRT